jgi:hypothetical protein
MYWSLPKHTREWMEGTVEQYETHGVEQFLIASLILIIDSQKSVGGTSMLRSALGQQVAVQLVLRNERGRLNLTRVLQEVTSHYPNYQANPAIAHTLIWFMNQAPAHPDDLSVWLTFFAPSFNQNATSSAASFQGLSLKWIINWSQQVQLVSQAVVKPTVLQWDLFETVLVSAYSSNSYLLGSKKGLEFIEQLQSVYIYLKSKLLHPRSLVILDLEETLTLLFPLLLIKDEILVKEVSSLAVEVLARYPRGFKLWWSLFPNIINESLILLRYIDLQLPNIAKKLDTVELQYFVGRVKVEASQWNTHYRNSVAVSFYCFTILTPCVL